jgi:hypothetical protein
MKGMTLEQPLERQPHPFKNPVFLNGTNGIVRATGSEAATRRTEGG